MHYSVATTSCSHQQALITFSDFMKDLLVIAEWWPSSAPHHHLAPSRGDGVVAVVSHTFRPVEGEGEKGGSSS